MTGVKPARLKRQGILIPSCLPIPPHRIVLHKVAFHLGGFEYRCRFWLLPQRNDTIHVFPCQNFVRSRQPKGFQLVLRKGI